MKNLINLIGVKKIIALLLTLIFCYLSLIGRIEAKDFINIYLLIIGAYFGQSIAKANQNKE